MKFVDRIGKGTTWMTRADEFGGHAGTDPSRLPLFGGAMTVPLSPLMDAGGAKSIA
jgi:hypothetical protein